MDKAGMAVRGEVAWTLVGKRQLNVSLGQREALANLIDTDAVSDDLKLAEVLFNTHTVAEKFKQWRKGISGEGEDMVPGAF